MKLKIKKYKNNRGFTLIEMLVSVAIFSMIVLVIIGGLISVMKTKQMVLQKVYLYDNGRFILESILREARVSKMLTINGSILSLNHPLLGIINYEFDANTNSITRQIGDGPKLKLNPDNVKVTGWFANSISCVACYSNYQPLSGVLLKIADINNKQEVILQSAVSQRNLEL
jgi:prepilin-type N-terminal cleavage/methylation domain-containing protein